MIAFISYHHDDKPLMVRWANHIKKLGGVSKHHIIVMPAHGVSTDGVMEPLTQAFGKAEELPCFHTDQGWPVSCNRAFEQAAWHSYHVAKQSFLWMEPDAVPLKSSWLDDIEAEYKQCGKPFMGDFVKIAGVLPNGIDHMSGIAVYHWDMPRILPSVFNNDHAAWDIVSGREVIPQMHRTKLIHHDWLPTKQWRREVVTKDCVNPLAVIYHPDKLGVLFDDSLAGVETRAEREPSTGACGDASSFEQSAPATSLLFSGFDSSLIDIIHYAKTDSKCKKTLISRLAEEGIIKPTKTKKAKPVKRPRKQVQIALGND
jgi:hypothetical protein